MMKICFVLFTFLSAPFFASSQTFKDQVAFSASDGFISGQQLVQGSLKNTAGHTDITSATGNPFVTLQYYTGNNAALSLCAGRQQFSTASYDNGLTPFQRNNYSYTTIAAEYLVNYLNRRHVRAYTYFGAGCSVYEDHVNTYYSNNILWQSYTQKHVSFNMQYVPVGISIGGMLSAFAEVGIGYKGILNAGACYRFPKYEPAK